MNSTLSKTIIFAVGAAIGSAVTWKLVKDKYEGIARDEIAEMREYYRKKNEPTEKEGSGEYDKSIVNIDADVSALDKYRNLANQYSVEKEEKGGAESMEDEDKPYVITPEEFGEMEDYETASLTYYADGVLEDDQCNIIENPDDLVGENFADHYGEFEEDAVHVRNDKYKTDYEILLDVRTYAEAASVNSYKDGE